MKQLLYGPISGKQGAILNLENKFVSRCSCLDEVQEFVATRVGTGYDPKTGYDRKKNSVLKT